MSRGELYIIHIPSSEQLADLLTKALSKSRFLFLLSKIGISDGFPIMLKNSCEEIKYYWNFGRVIS